MFLWQVESQGRGRASRLKAKLADAEAKLAEPKAKIAEAEASAAYAEEKGKLLEARAEEAEGKVLAAERKALFAVNSLYPVLEASFCWPVESLVAEREESDPARKLSSPDLGPPSSIGSSGGAGGRPGGVGSLNGSLGLCWVETRGCPRPRGGREAGAAGVAVPCFKVDADGTASTVWTPVYEKQGPKWCIASPGGPRRVQTYPGLGSTTRMPFSPDTGKPRTAIRGRANPHGSGSVEILGMLQQEFTATTGCAIEDKLAEGLSNSRLRILEAARKKRHLAAFFENLDSRAAGEDAGPENGRA
ncbi:hypothetical protein ISCGN_019120 [Ixodes scapularis]